MSHDALGFLKRRRVSNRPEIIRRPGNWQTLDVAGLGVGLFAGERLHGAFRSPSEVIEGYVRS